MVQELTNRKLNSQSTVVQNTKERVRSLKRQPFQEQGLQSEKVIR